MADERDLEILDDYITNRLSEQDRAAFEQKLQADPELQNEFMLQERLVKGIKNARVAELKSMLNNIPVSPTGPGQTLAAKIAIGTALSILIAAASYWYFNQDRTKMAQPVAPAEEKTETPVTPKPGQEPETTLENQTVETDKNQTSAGTEESKPSQAKKPTPLNAPQEKTSDDQSPVKEPVLDIFDPATEENQNEATEPKENQQDFSPNHSSLIVETDTENRRYTFNYQFKDGKVFLYGPFEKNLYEIMEFFSDEKRTVFLYYKDNYYLLEERDYKIRPLTTIADPLLLKKLKEYRSKK